MSTSPIGPTGPHGSNEKIEEPIPTNGGAAAQPKKTPQSGQPKPNKNEKEIGPTGPHLTQTGG